MIRFALPCPFQAPGPLEAGEVALSPLARLVIEVRICRWELGGKKVHRRPENYRKTTMNDDVSPY